MPRHQLSTTVDIAAPPAMVWEVLTDLDAYGQWNPFIPSASLQDGDTVLAEGSKLKNRMLPPGGRAMTFSPTITELVDGRVFEWLGRLLLPGLFDGRHRFELEAITLSPGATGDDADDRQGTRLHHSEQFSGLLVPVFRRSLDKQTRSGFEAMNDALKDRAEARFIQSGTD